MTLPWRKPWPLLTFDPVHHDYRVGRDGRLVPSVTQVLDRAGLGVRLDLPTMQAAMSRGRAVHLATQFLDEGRLDRESVDSSWAGYLAAYEKFKSEANPTILLIEQPFHHDELGYAGTIDRVVAFPHNTAGPLDIKTGSVPKTTAAQLAGYGMGLESALGHEDFKPIKEAMEGYARARWSLLLRANGTYCLSRHAGGEALWMAALTIARFKEENDD